MLFTNNTKRNSERYNANRMKQSAMRARVADA